MITRQRAVRAALATLAIIAAAATITGPASADVPLQIPSAVQIDTTVGGSGSAGIPVSTGSSQLFSPPATFNPCRYAC